MSFEKTLRDFSRACTFGLLVSLAACGGSSNLLTATGGTDCTQPTTSDSDGCTFVSLTDASTNFLSYTVNVTALSLTRSDGTVVNLLPATTTVDFAQYSSLSEFLTLTSMPPGTYTSGSITLDFSNSDIEVTDTNGNAVQVSPVDQNGNPITTETMAIDLDSQGDLVLAPGVPKVFQVDFDLDASNTVDLSNDTVTVQPFLVASVDPNFTNQIAVRGPLATVDTTDSDFTLGLKPFYAGSGNYGKLKVFTTSSTTYDINQTTYTGSAGLTALSAAGATTAVVAKGTFNFTSNEFIASEVDAGSSVPGGTMDVASGVVVSRSGDALVLRGTTLYRAGQTAVFRDSVAVTVGTNTKVHEAGSGGGSFDISDISVGQRLMVFGTLTDTAPTALALDATAGDTRLEHTKFDGTVVSAPVTSGSNSTMTVDVQFIEGRPVSMFDFAGTGTSSGTDANPSQYVVTAATSVFSGVNLNDPVRVWGFVTPFGSAPPDFTSDSVADYVNANALLAMGWASPGSTDVFTSESATNGLTINLASTPTPLLADLVQGGVVTQLTSLAAAPTVTGTLGLYAIAQNGTIQVHLTLAGFITDLNSRLSAGAKIRGFFAHGGFTSSSDTVSAAQIAVIVQ